MDEAEKKIEECLRKMEIIEEFIALNLRRTKIANDVQNISKEVNEVHELMMDVKKMLLHDLDNIEADHDNIMRRSRNLQQDILDELLSERQQKLKEEAEEEQCVQKLLMSGSKNPIGIAATPIPVSVNKHLTASLAKLGLNQGVLTPKMTIYDYKESPLSKRNKINPIPFYFSEFDVQVSKEQFDTIPKYMRERVTLEELNSFLETVIISCFNDKYKLMHRARSAVRHSEMELWKLYNEQKSYIPGRNFITEGDISRHLGRQIDKKLSKRIVMLRHVGILQEQRIAQTVCYVWTPTGFGGRF